MSNLDNFLNPLGTEEYVDNGRAVNSSADGSIYGGIPRHYGEFSSDNTYYKQLKGSGGNLRKKDRDALYERAVEEQAKIDNFHREANLDYAFRQEEREYNLPINEIARQRAAGINPDIAGASGSAGAGSSSANSIDAPDASKQVQAHSQFANVYADTQQVLGIVGTAANTFSSFASGISSIASAFSTIKSLPSQISVNSAQADLMQTQANEIETLLSGKQEYQSLINNQERLKYATGVLQQLLNMREFLTSDSDISPILTAMGTSSDDIPLYQNAFKEIMDTPAIAARTNTEKIEVKRTAAQNALYTSEYFGRILHKEQELQELQADWQLDRQLIDNLIMKAINPEEYAQNLAESMEQSAENAVAQSKQSAIQLEQYAKSYFNKIAYLADTQKKAEVRLEELETIATKRQLNVVEQAEKDQLIGFIPYINALGVEKTNEIYAVRNSINRYKFSLNANDSYDVDTGKIAGMSNENTLLHYGQVYYGQIVQGATTTQELVKDWVNTSIYGLQSIGVLALGLKGMKKGGTTYNPQSTTYSLP